MPARRILYFDVDQLNTPRAARDQTGVVVWRWEGDAFGATPPNQNPSGKGIVTVNLRFPGQYFDQESGLSYNAMRDYDPGIGRYVESDPIGLSGGSFSTYQYASSNPLSFIDPKGLAGLRLPGLPLPIVPPANPGVGSPGGGGTGNPDLDAGGGYYYKKPSWPSWPPGGDVPRDDPWPKDDKNFCIRTYANCENYNWTGSCQACLDLCKGSDSGDWPFHMCKPRNKNQCE